jgi:hypothetical protein
LPDIEEILSGLGGDNKKTYIIQRPGLSFIYSNPGYILLQLLIEEATNLNFCKYMQHEILNPLGMNSSGFECFEDLQTQTATPYNFNGEPILNYISNAKAVGGLHCTAEDLARFIIAGMQKDIQLKGNGILNPSLVALLYSPVIETDGIYKLASDAYGLGYFVEMLPNGNKAVMHGGEADGWMAHFYSVPDLGDGIVILTNIDRSHEFISDIVSYWAAWREYPSVKMTRSISLIKNTIQNLTALFLFLSIILCLILFKQIKSKSRIWRPLSKKSFYIQFFKFGVPFFIIIGWCLFVYPFLYDFLPSLIPQLSYSLYVFCAVIILFIMFPK